MSELSDVHLALLARAPALLLADVELAFADWEVVGVRGGAVLVRENEVHVAVKDEARGRWLSRKLIRQILGKMLEHYGVVKTSVKNDNGPGREFVERLGFERVGSDEGKVSYELRALRF